MSKQPSPLSMYQHLAGKEAMSLKEIEDSYIVGSGGRKGQREMEM